MNKLTIQENMQKGVCVLEISGVLDIGSLEILQKKVNDVIGKGHTTILIDFKNIAQVSSLGLGVLISICKNVGKVNGKLALCSLRHEVEDVFHVTRLMGIFNVFKSQEDAFVGFERGFESPVETSIRRFKRVKAHIPVDLQIYKMPGSEKYAASTIDLEYEGVFIQGENSYEKDDVIEMTLHLPGEDIRLLGRVAWIAQKDRHPQQYPGFGVHFINADDVIRKKLEPYLSSINL